MKRARIMSAILFLFLSSLTPVSQAHHSFAMYDQNQRVTLTGRLTRYIPGANHAQMIFDLLDDSGAPVTDE